MTFGAKIKDFLLKKYDQVYTMRLTESPYSTQ